ncbi:MAG: metallophosphoesterase [Alphaproteobacteria bacterium]|nr:metallophosphoesterase [Alphaproteobacteria bacterium]
MSFLIAYLVVAFSCIIITVRTLIAYTDCSALTQTLVYGIFIFAWLSPILIWKLQTNGFLPLWLYSIFAKLGYFMLGFAFLLLFTIILRDIIWTASYYLSGKNIVSPLNHQALRTANIITLSAVFIICLYSVYAAEKLPAILHYQYRDSRIQKPLKALLISDLHITKMTPVSKVQSWVKYFNAQNPDIILMPGDIADDAVSDIKKQIKELKKLKAPLGIYYTLGNHETYFDAIAWEAEFAGLGWQVLHNSGTSVADTGLYIAGLPDTGAFAVNVTQAVRNAQSHEYRIMLSHIPTTFNLIKPHQVDLQVSGHTHGGQIFPFNWLTKWGNKGYVFGEYTSSTAKMLISHGVGYWGPPMRLMAPSDAILIELLPES